MLWRLLEEIGVGFTDEIRDILCYAFFAAFFLIGLGFAVAYKPKEKPKVRL